MINTYGTNIIFIGMPGSGKSTLGVLLAKALGMSFIDTDIIIQQHERRLLQEIIDYDGIDRFLKIEETIVSGIRPENSVIATGGSVVYSEKAMDALKLSGRVVYLKVSFDEINNRVKDITTRGVVLRKGRGLWDAYNERCPLYEKYSDIVIECSGKSVEQCITELVKRLDDAVGEN